jgi:hypothetical protein
MALPPALPPPQPSATDGYEVTCSFTAEGSVSDYPTRVIDSIAVAFARQAGVSREHVKVAVTAGSVVIAVSIAVPDEAAADEVVLAVGSVTSNATTATEFLSDATGVPTAVHVRSTPVAQMASANVAPTTSASNTWPIVLASTGATAVVCGLFAWYRRKRAGETSPIMKWLEDDQSNLPSAIEHTSVSDGSKAYDFKSARL